MKKMASLILVVLLLAAISCKGDTTSNSGNPGTYNTQAKVISESAVQAGIFAVLYALEAALTDYVTNRCDEGAGLVGEITANYSDLIQSGTDNGTIVLSYDFTSSNCDDDSGVITFIFNVPSGSISHSQVVVEARIIDMTIDDTEFLGMTFSTTEDVEITGSIFGTFTGETELLGTVNATITPSSLNLNELSLSLSQLKVTLPDATTGTVTLNDSRINIALDENGDASVTISQGSTSLTYGEEDYSCTEVGGTLTWPFRNDIDRSYVPSTEISCICTNC